MSRHARIRVRQLARGIWGWQCDQLDRHEASVLRQVGILPRASGYEQTPGAAADAGRDHLTLAHGIA